MIQGCCRGIANGRYIVYFSPQDFALVMKYDWGVTEKGNTLYAVRYEKRSPVYMHREILKTDAIVDHADGNGLNNVRENLRIADKSKNAMNSCKRGGCSSKYKGVYFRKDRNKWQAYINLEGKRTSLGCYDTEIEAAMAYNKSALQLHREFARLNTL